MLLQVFDPAMCCDTGVCGVEVDPELSRVAAGLTRLRSRGVRVERHNLGHEPGAFAASAVVREALQREGVGVLPMLLLDGREISRGRYPSDAELQALTEGAADVAAH